MTEAIRRELFLPHRPEDVWSALTDPAALEDWLMPGDFEPRVGHRFTFRTEPNPQYGFDGLVHCEVLECTPPSKLAYTWAGGSVQGTRVDYRLEPEGDGTRLYFEHSGFDVTGPAGDGALKGAEYGWAGMLGKLEEVLAARAAAS